ncbi:MAG: NAD(P)/FAD-dependent oxidoreductase [Rubrivivax sp.]|nr:MAG: NAD(P)/FAD-dependent oxidoreductase [Rubrivivax sp.]
MDERAGVLIVGTGFSGLCMAIRLKQSGADDFIILERASDVGGTWRDNHYPGCACDVQSHLYSYSFEPNPDWSRQFAPQPEIWAYLRRCAEKYGILPHIRYDANVVASRFDEASSTWVVSKPDWQRSEWAKQLTRALPFTQKLHRWATYWILEGRVLGGSVRPGRHPEDTQGPAVSGGRAPRGAAKLRGPHAVAPEGHRLGFRLQELVRQRERQKHHAVAGIHLPLPPDHQHFQPARLRRQSQVSHP